MSNRYNQPLQRRSLTVSSSGNSIIKEQEAHIASLQKEVKALTNKLMTLQQKHAIETSNKNPLSHQIDSVTPTKRAHRLTPFGNIVGASQSDTSRLRHERNHMGRNVSIATEKELSSLTAFQEEKRRQANHQLVKRILDMFDDPANHIKYLKSKDFYEDLKNLCSKVKRIFEAEPRCAFLQSPCYVFGDIHGNLEDLHFFSDNVWKLGLELTAGNFLFLGDYVDRGMNCLECLAYLFSLKFLYPHKVFLLRGNHETRDVNGWEEHYGNRSFLWQCKDRFGTEMGFKIYECCNQVFDRMPLAAVIDQNIFCVHGGIPRPVTIEEDGTIGSRIQDILNVQKIAGINPPYDHEDEDYHQVASDCIWSDPASEEQELHSVDSKTGYGESLRGGGAICFGHRAVTDFLEQHGFSYIMRAHEAHSEGVAVSKGGRVFTIFSTSKDHNQGNQAMAGCILVDFDLLQVINRSPAYRNVYVHRRNSVSIAKLSEEEIADRQQLGLISATFSYDNDEDEYEEDEFEEFEDTFEEDHEEYFDYSFASGRKSSVLPNQTVSSPSQDSRFLNVQTDRRSNRDMHPIDEEEDTDIDEDQMDLDDKKNDTFSSF